jgi:hypothetical protein
MENATAELKVPEDFVRLAHCFDEEEYEWGIENMSEWIKKVLPRTRLSTPRMQSLKDYFDRLLASGSDRALEEAWMSTSPIFICVGPGATRKFLGEIRDLMDVFEIVGTK